MQVSLTEAAMCAKPESLLIKRSEFCISDATVDRFVFPIKFMTFPEPVKV
jgi:hypothetical protein